METIEYRTKDKSDWLRGPWDSEPDKVQFPDPDTGLPCLLHRGPSGHWCGYVGVAKDHLAFEMPYDKLDAKWDIDVHGGLTFSSFCKEKPVELGEPDESEGICHVPGPDDPERVWWLGFDCAHSGDYTGMSTGQSYVAQDYDNIYRTADYVKEQCALLAKQLAGMVAV